MKKINRTNLKYYLFCLLIAFIVLLFTSKCSFLYKFNEWVDANAFFTMGKSMMKGVIPYKDLFEQKGPILYFIYGIGYLISNTNFHGIFIIEVISLSISLYFIYKIESMYLDKKYSLLIIPFFAVITTTSFSFVQGGSSEELSLPFLIISLYYFIKHFKNRELTTKEIIINGILAGIVFMMKYTLVGLFIGFVFCIFINYIKKKDIKKAFIFCIKYLIGMMIPILICLIYLYLNNALLDFFNIYFKINLTSYGSNVNYDLFSKIISIITMAFYMSRNNGYFYILLITLMFVLCINIKKRYGRVTTYITLLFLFSVFVINYGANPHRYYQLPLFVFTIIPLIYLFDIGKKYIDKVINSKLIYLVIIVIISFSYFGANYKKDLFDWHKDYYQFKYARYINKYNNPKILNFGYLDLGIYTISGAIPNVRYFELQNMVYDNYPDNIDEMENYIKNKEIDFIVYYTVDFNTYYKEEYNDYYVPDFLYDNYEKVYEEKVDSAIIYLFEIKNKCPLKN